jgi:hypothetical protein
MTKPKKPRTNIDRSGVTDIGPKTRKLVECKCTLRCNGSKMVDPRTFKKHQQEMEKFHAIRFGSQGSSRSDIKGKTVNIGSSSTSRQRKKEKFELIEENRDSSDDYSGDDDPNPVDDQDLNYVTKKRKRYSKFHDTTYDQDDNPEPLTEEDSDEDFEEPVNSDSAAEEDDPDLSDDEIPFEQFTAPDLPDLEELFDFETENTNVKFDDSWILLWILKFQSRFQLPDTAIDSLIKFVRMILIDANRRRFEDFPTSAYMARKLLGIGKQEKIYAVCPSCNTLYKVAEILPDKQASTGFKCTHVEFPNHPRHNRRQACGTELTNKVPVVNGFIRRPKMLFPIPSLKIQIITMYQRPGFQELLQKWTNRGSEDGLYSDIYDGEIWKTFPSSLDDPDSRFFTTETADSHLGLMINLDWFQPFESSVYSSGVIYGVICNLPREVRFKRENMLYLGLLPGPKEVKLHKINHYLNPIIDELLEFWNGFDLPPTSIHSRKRIRMAVICCSNDIPAARKLCGHISSLAACHRCYKIANVVGNKLNYGGFDDIDEWFIQKDLNEHRDNAEGWRFCKSVDERRRYVSNKYVRWSEMLRLPYFSPIRHLVVDPMHCLFLGVAHWIVKRLWIDSGKLGKSDLEEMEKRTNSIKVPADLGRIPHKIATGEGFSGFTADQWKNFILIYAIPLMWDLLGDSDQEILNNFVRACSLLVCRIIDDNVLNEAHYRLLSVARLIEENYGPELITSNIHLSLHLVECCRDYGPLYSFWCYSFERMNGVLGEILY